MTKLKGRHLPHQQDRHVSVMDNSRGRILLLMGREGGGLTNKYSLVVSLFTSCW